MPKDILSSLNLRYSQRGLKRNGIGLTRLLVENLPEDEAADALYDLVMGHRPLKTS